MASLSRAQRAVKKDFYFSFLHSQGETSLQSSIYVFLADRYRMHGPVLSADEIALGKQWLPFSRLPRNHIPNHATSEPSETEAHNFTRILRVNQYSIHNQTVNSIYEGVLERDIWWQDKNRRIGDDIHASYFRKHVIFGEPTGLTRYDAMYKEVGRQIATPELAIMTQSLVEAWQFNHPGEQFYPTPET